MMGTTFTLPVGSVWVQDDGYRVKVVGHNADGWPVCRHVSGRGPAWEINPAWFEQWERA